ncbi:MarR family transcriptional regulator [Couchioplanes caeruleus]|uniref:MarR family winged helix-turn-helix transcriptional regulator n=1 Tax=Couchioplanes caeruleus TaxID=56438 RepID=UPI0020C11228|nr:MarR family transcriptional regulator [Couchioplanes caeruleus]UQU62594.1 MarR family transcriptional regulator [Couchioplanes caeruleus]
MRKVLASNRGARSVRRDEDVCLCCGAVGEGGRHGAVAADAVQAYRAAVDDTDREMARILKVNRTDLRCLELLLNAGGVSPRELGHRLGLTTGSVTAMLDRLERLGLLTRTRHPSDRRMVVVSMTATAAARCYDLYAPLIADGNADLAEKFDLDQLRLITQAMRTLTEAQNRHVDRLLNAPR